MTAIEPRIYLASRSPRRRELLHQIGVRFDLLLFRDGLREDAEVDEGVRDGEAPDAYVTRIALAKARHGIQLVASRHLQRRPVLAADTTLDLAGAVIGKPRNVDDAAEILARLSGATHRVLTAVAVADGERIEHRLSDSAVRFKVLSAEEIKRYVATGEPLDKAGAYGLQGRAAIFVDRVEGSPSGIVGLPLFETAALLRSFGYPL